MGKGAGPRVPTAEELFEKGLFLVEEGDVAGALDVAADLERRSFSGAFELAARAHFATGDLDAAIDVLERGVDVAPEVWINWQLLGSYRSDRGEYEEAQRAYDRALACPDCWMDSVRLNQAILALRRGEAESALRYLELVRDGELADERRAVEVDARIAAGDLDSARILAESALDSCDPEDGPLRSRALVALADVGRRQSGDLEAARDLLCQAFEADPANPSVLWHLRELAPARSDEAGCYRVLVHGKLAESDCFCEEAEGFYASYDVVADDLDEALRYIRDLERVRSCSSLEIDEHELLEESPDQPKGVYSRSGWVFYDERS